MTSIQNTPVDNLPTQTQRAVHCAARLRLVLRINATSSTLCGVVMAAIPDTVDELLDTGHPRWIRLIGLGLVLFALIVAYVSTLDDRTLAAATPAIIAGDIAWVVGSIATVLLGWYSGGGIVAVLAVAIMVDVFAVMQWHALRQIR